MKNLLLSSLFISFLCYLPASAVNMPGAPYYNNPQYIPTTNSYQDEISTPRDTHSINSISSQNSEQNNLQAQIKRMKLRETNATAIYGIYCEQHNPSKPVGDYSEQRHYYWDKAKQKMVELPGVYYVSDNAYEVQDMLDNYKRTGKMTNF